MKILDNIGHFPHMEARDEVIAMLKELFTVPSDHERNSHNNWCGN
jgi:hypothetical protein